MQILVLYYSRTGHTKQMAEAVVAGVHEHPGAKALLRSTEEVTKEDFVESAGIVAGSPVYFGGMAAPMKEVMDKFVGVRRKMANKIGAAFTTSGDATGGKETTLLGILQAFLIYGMIVVGDPLEATGHYGASSVGAPDEKGLDMARQLGFRVAELAAKVSS